MSLASEELSHRLRALLAPVPFVTEQKMFGGRAFMLSGNMLVAATKQGSLLVRVGRHASQQLLSLPGAAPMTMGARTMAGFLEVSGDVLEDDAALADWMNRARLFVATLPPK